MHVNALQALSSPILEDAVSLVSGERDDENDMLRRPYAARCGIHGGSCRAFRCGYVTQRPFAHATTVRRPGSPHAAVSMGHNTSRSSSIQKRSITKTRRCSTCARHKLINLASL